MRKPPYCLLLPPPREVAPASGVLTLAAGSRAALAVAEDAPPFARERVASALAAAELVVVAEGAPAELVVRLACGTRGQENGGEEYALVVAPDGVRIEGAGPAGLLHGCATLAQLLRTAQDTRALPCAALKDAPAFAHRGWMLDVSRNRVPTLATLRRLIDLLAEWKGNELQLYTEHTFAYAGHEEVWHGWDPYTPDEMRAMDSYAAARGVALVPNQNCFGHLHHWLVHARYRDLAEVPEGVEHPFARDPEPFSLCATDPRSLAFVGELFDQLLPCFRSREVNVGLDETFDVGLGRSKEACARSGKGRVYLEFLRGVHALVAARTHRMQFWADVLLEHPTLVREVPADAIALLWGYEAAHPFDEQAARVAESGLSFAVCPGTGAWQSLAGRTTNLVANVDAAIRAGLRHGARGVLVTDWGDRGHLQPEWASYAGWALASALAWNPTPPAGIDPREPAVLAGLLDAHAFEDRAGALGRIALELGRAGEVTGAHAVNASPLSLLLTEFEEPFPLERVQGLDPAGLERALAHVDATLARLPYADCRRPDAALVRDEFLWVGGLLRFAARFGLERFHAGGALASIPDEKRSQLVLELAPLVEELRRLWLARSRPGGLEPSVDWLERVQQALD